MNENESETSRIEGPEGVAEITPCKYTIIVGWRKFGSVVGQYTAFNKEDGEEAIDFALEQCGLKED